MKMTIIKTIILTAVKSKDKNCLINLVEWSSDNDDHVLPQRIISIQIFVRVASTKLMMIKIQLITSLQF